MSAAAQTQDGGSRTLVRKLSEVMGEVERVPKNGRNAHHNYDYATEADIVAVVRKGLAQRQVMMLPTVRDVSTRPGSGKGGEITRLVVDFTFHDGESGESITVSAAGEGQDPGDKGAYKALTGAVKYVLTKTFLIPTGDDPEADEPPARGQQQAQQQRAPSPAAGGGKPAAQGKPAEDPVAKLHRLMAAAKSQAKLEEVGEGIGRGIAAGAINKAQEQELRKAYAKHKARLQPKKGREPGAEG